MKTRLLLAASAAMLAICFSLASCSSGGGGGGGGGGDTEGSFSNGQNAMLVIGQANFTGTSAVVDDATFGNVYGYGAVDSESGTIYLTDIDRNRILGFNALPSSNGASADFVLGQSDMISSTPETTATKFEAPEGIIISGGKMFVGDGGNGRILIWNTPPTSAATPADVVVGHADFTTGTTGNGDTGICNFENFFVVGTKLLVADKGCHRVMIWSTIPTSDGEAADLVLGQTDFSGESEDAGEDDPNAVGLNEPYGIWSDGTRLFVSDWGNSRIMVWNTFPTGNGEAADWALGQPDMTSNEGGTTANKFLGTWGLASDGTSLALADADNNRVLIWNTIPTSNVDADVVLGQPDMTTSTEGTTQSKFTYPSSPYFYGDYLIVSDGENSRYMVFQRQ